MDSTDINKQSRKKIDKLFIEALEKICKASKSAGIKPDTIGGINAIIHPKSKSYFSNVKGGRFHIPLNVLVKFAETYNVDMNYFFYDDVDLKFDLNKFLPASKQQKKKEDLSAYKLSDINFKTNIDFEKEDISKHISFETEEVAKSFRVDTLIRLFVKILPEDSWKFFYNILDTIKFNYEYKVLKLKEKIDLLNDELREANNSIQNAQRSENAALRALLEERT